MTTELYLVGTRRVCSLPPLPSPRFEHTMDIMDNMAVVCGGYRDKIGDGVQGKSCISFSPLSMEGTWENYTTLQYKYGFQATPSWLSEYGLLLFGSSIQNLELLPFSADSQVVEFDTSRGILDIRRYLGNFSYA